MAAVTLKQMGRHANTSYCVAITKTEEKTYEPTITICFDDPVVIECDELHSLYETNCFSKNPYALMVNFCIGFIDSRGASS